MSFLRRVIYYLWYFGRPPWDSGVTPPEFIEFLKDCPPGAAIDMGCGTGTNVISLARLGWKVTGVDYIPTAIQRAREKIRRAGVVADVRLGDVTRLDDIQDKVDLALDLGCYHSLARAERQAYLGQLQRLLKPGATWFLYAFVHSSEDNQAVGLTPLDLAAVDSFFQLNRRIDGFDGGEKTSAYFIFEKR